MATKKRKFRKFRSTICNSDISLAYNGQRYIAKHKETKAHKDNEKSVEGTRIIPTLKKSDLPPSIAAE